MSRKLPIQRTDSKVNFSKLSKYYCWNLTVPTKAVILMYWSSTAKFSSQNIQIHKKMSRRYAILDQYHQFFISKVLNPDWKYSLYPGSTIHTCMDMEPPVHRVFSKVNLKKSPQLNPIWWSCSYIHIVLLVYLE